MTGDSLGCGGLVIGSVLAAAGVIYRIAIGNPGGELPAPEMDRWAVQVGTMLILLAGAIAIAGAVAGYIIDRRRLYRTNINDMLCRGKLEAVMASVTKENPQRTVFAGIEEAKQFIFDLDGSCGYDYGWDMLSFQKIDYPPWDMYFCHECSYKFRDLSATSLARQDFGTCHSRATFEGSADGSDLSH